MPNPTPPVDAQKSIDRGQYVRHGDKRIYIGECLEASTPPGTSGFCYIVMFDSNGTRWAGYLWRED